MILDEASWKGTARKDGRRWLMCVRQYVYTLEGPAMVGANSIDVDDGWRKMSTDSFM